MIDLDKILKNAGAVATGVLLYDGSHTPKSLAVATDEDWVECLERARHRISIGSGRIENDQTWEEALAAWGAWYLRLGAGETAMGRTSNEVEWAVQKERWLDAIFDVAAKGSVYEEHGFYMAEDAEKTFITKVDALKLVELSPTLELIHTSRSTNLVFTAAGWKQLSEISRTVRS